MNRTELRSWSRVVWAHDGALQAPGSTLWNHRTLKGYQLQANSLTSLCLISYLKEPRSLQAVMGLQWDDTLKPGSEPVNVRSQPHWGGRLVLCVAASCSSPAQRLQRLLSNVPAAPLSRGPRYHLLAHTVLTLTAVQDGFRTHDLTLASHGEYVGVEDAGW